jgi:hypothetical protein
MAPRRAQISTVPISPTAFSDLVACMAEKCPHKGIPKKLNGLGFGCTTNFFRMSAFGPKRTSLVAPHMSAFGGKADKLWRTEAHR